MVVTRNSLKLKKRKLNENSSLNNEEISTKRIKKKIIEIENLEEINNSSEIEIVDSEFEEKNKSNNKNKRKVSKVENNEENLNVNKKSKLKNKNLSDNKKKKGNKKEDKIIIITDSEVESEEDENINVNNDNETEIIDIENVSDNENDFEVSKKYNLRKRKPIIYENNSVIKDKKDKKEDKNKIEEEEEEEEEEVKVKTRNKRKETKGKSKGNKNSNNKRKKEIKEKDAIDSPNLSEILIVDDNLKEEDNGEVENWDSPDLPKQKKSKKSNNKINPELKEQKKDNKKKSKAKKDNNEEDVIVEKVDDKKESLNSSTNTEIILNDDFSEESENDMEFDDVEDEAWEPEDNPKKSKNNKKNAGKNKEKNKDKIKKVESTRKNNKKKKEEDKSKKEIQNNFIISEKLAFEDNLSEESENDEEWEQVDISTDNTEISSSDKLLKDKKSFTISFDKNNKKEKKEKKRGINKQDRDLRKYLHQIQIMCLLSSCRIWNSWCNLDILQNLGLSIIPKELLFNKKEIKSGNIKKLSELIEDFCEWFIDFVGKKNIELINKNSSDNTNRKGSVAKKPSVKSKYFDNKNKEDDSVEDSDSKSEDKKERKYEVKNSKVIGVFINYPQWIKFCENAENIYIILFVLFARVVGFQCRFIASLYPIPLSFSKKKIYNDDAIKLWCEIYCAKEKKWIAVNPLYKSNICTKLFEYKINCSKPVNYIVSINQDGYIQERIKRYDKKFYLSTWKLRIDEDWWNDIIKLVFNKGHKDDKLKEIIPEEEDIDKNLVFPTSIGGYVNHPLFALERHVKQYEVLFSKEPVLGYFRNEPIYPRKNVRPVSTEGHWVREGLQIKEGEKPQKYTKSKAYMIKQFRLEYLIKKKMDLPKDYELGEELVPLYGKWQTERYVPKPIVNGILPKSKFGNIDLFKPWMLPKGAVHLNYKGIVQVAKRLGVEYAEAVTDIEIGGFNYVPTISGIVVLEEDAEKIMSKYKFYEKEKERKLKERKEKRIISNWRRLIKKLITREQLIAKYGYDKEKREFDDDVEEEEEKIEMDE